MAQSVLHGIILGSFWGIIAVVLITIIDTTVYLITKAEKIRNIKPSIRFLEGIAGGSVAYFTVGLLKSPTASAVTVLTVATIYATLTPKLLKLTTKQISQ